MLSSESQPQQKHFAMPKLMGAPAYARPARLVEATPRPLDPDDLPLEAHRTPEEHELASTTRPGVVSWGPVLHASQSPEAEAEPDTAGKPRSFVARLGLRRG